MATSIIVRRSMIPTLGVTLKLLKYGYMFNLSYIKMLKLSTESSTKPQIYRTYSDTDRKAVVEFYEQHDCKVTALKLIRANAGFENMTDRKIKRWMNALGIKKSAGRPVCDQFEAEVLAECDKCAQQSMSTDSHQYSYSFVRECAHRVLNNYYWDEDCTSCTKKWMLDKRTCNLKFTNKWVSGLLRRSSVKNCPTASSTSTATHLDELMPAQQSADEVSVISSDWDLLLLED